jgi:tRNA A37 threonylcarbamoyladenosine modification protein TsaB
MPRIDALRGQVFAALYRRGENGTLRKVLKEAMATEEEWMAKVKKIMGPRLRHRGRLASHWVSPLQGCYPDAAVLLELARQRLAKAKPESYKGVLPLYIRQAAAVERRRT